jgi:CHAT domain-containing protein
LAFAEPAQDKFDAGIASYKKAIDAFNALNRVEQAARAEVGLSRALTGSGAHQAALEAAAHARAQAETLKNDDILWRAQVAQAEALRQLRERPKAMVTALAAVTAVERLLAGSQRRPSTTVARDTSSAFALLALLQAEEGDAASAFETVERMRVHDLRLLLAPGERDIYRGMTERERDEERAIVAELVSLQAQLSRERSLPKPDAARIARLESAISDATTRRTAQQQALFERLPALRVWRGLMTPASRNEIEGLLADAGRLLLELVVTDQTLLTIVVRRGEEGLRFSASFESASRRTLAERVSRLLQPEIMRDVNAWRQAALELVPGLSATFGTASRAIVVPHEILWRVPFEALPTTDGYVSDSTAITYAPSVTSLLRAPDVERSRSSGALTIVTAPQIAPAVLDEVRRTAPGWTIRPTASAEQERDAIAPRDGADERIHVLSGAGATEKALIERAQDVETLHIAAPFRINGASPLFSSMLLASEPPSDGTLELRDVINLDVRASLAIFSDGASMTMMDAADETGAVAWAWRATGVKGVILPRWATDESAAMTFLASLHNRLRAGDAPGAALQAARSRLRESRATAAPFFWAGWLVVGSR